MPVSLTRAARLREQKTARQVYALLKGGALLVQLQLFCPLAHTPNPRRHGWRGTGEPIDHCGQGRIVAGVRRSAKVKREPVSSPRRRNTTTRRCPCPQRNIAISRLVSYGRTRSTAHAATGGWPPTAVRNTTVRRRPHWRSAPPAWPGPLGRAGPGGESFRQKGVHP